MTARITKRVAVALPRQFSAPFRRFTRRSTRLPLRQLPSPAVIVLTFAPARARVTARRARGRSKRTFGAASAETQMQRKYAARLPLRERPGNYASSRWSRLHSHFSSGEDTQTVAQSLFASPRLYILHVLVHYCIDDL
jgi:hypothetical protein